MKLFREQIRNYIRSINGAYTECIRIDKEAHIEHIRVGRGADRELI